MSRAAPSSENRRTGEESCTKFSKFRENVLNFIEHPRTQLALTVLLCIDVLIVITSVAIDAEYPSCPAALKVCGLDDRHECVNLPEHIQSLSGVLELISNSILALFVVEITLTAFGLGLRTYLTTPSYLFDAVVVIASLIVELAEGKRHHDTGLLVLARAWRFVSLLHGMNLLRQEGISGGNANHSDHAEGEGIYQPLS